MIFFNLPISKAVPKASKIYEIYYPSYSGRVEFLKKLLEYNKFKVVVIPSPPPKAAPAVATSEAEGGQPIESPAIPVETFTVGVTDYTFNSVNAIFGRLLHTPDGHVVTLAYWQQKELVSHDEIPYFEIDRG